jgi:hypothetical protein
MRTRILELTISTLILTYGVGGATAQDRMTPQLAQQQMQSDPMGEGGARTTGQGGMMGRGMMAGHMMGYGTMGPPHALLRVMFALMDADGDGTISLQEFQSAHERIFKGMDANRDGKLTPEEIKAFIESK